ncbi:hypothetical protein [Faecalibacillus intestinalis]|uniref:hypothetical protein n=1 Tax=Faecalibacillus intestinalis TaxID=1982626 RepID=UPI0022E8AF64|nr:hypothetical protein [Faecalibacillus intestinalis]
MKYSGCEPDIDIKSEYIGLKSREKLYEELFMKEEKVKDTPNHLLHIGKPIILDEDKFLQEHVQLKEKTYQKDSDIRTLIKQIADTYQPKKA